MQFICARMPGWRVAPSVLLDSPVPKPNIAAETNNGGEEKGGLKEGGRVPLIARKALENAGKATLQVLSTRQKYPYYLNHCSRLIIFDWATGEAEEGHHTSR